MDSLKAACAMLNISFLIVFCLMCIGWGMNMYKLVQLDFEPNYKAEVVRCIGIIPPIGGVLGYVTIEDVEKQ